MNDKEHEGMESKEHESQEKKMKGKKPWKKMCKGEY